MNILSLIILIAIFILYLLFSSAVYLACTFLYCLPIIIANRKNTAMHQRIATITLSLGWTIVGWFYALIMALNSADNSRPQDDPPRMRPRLYTLLFFIPLLTPFSLALFSYDAWCAMTFVRNNRKLALRSIIGLSVPILAAVYVFFVIYPFGRILKSKLQQMQIKSEFGEAFSKATSYLWFLIGQPLLFIVSFSFINWLTIDYGHSIKVTLFPEIVLLITVCVVALFGIISTISMYYNYSSAINVIRCKANS